MASSCHGFGLLPEHLKQSLIALELGITSGLFRDHWSLERAKRLCTWTANQMGNPRKAFEGVEGCGECWEANWGWETLRYTDRDFFLAPMPTTPSATALALLNRILPERRLCWLYVRLSWTYPGPMLAVCCPRSALCEAYVGPCRPYVGPILA